MELERRNIERSDFPQARRGYDRDAVDRHLRAIADAVEELRAAQVRPGAAGAAAEQVEAIVAAAEASAREIEERARSEADEARRRAEAEAREHVERAEQAAKDLAERAADLQREADSLVAQVRDAASALAIRIAPDPAVPRVQGLSDRQEGDVPAAPAPAAPTPAPVVPEAPRPERQTVEATVEEAREAGAGGGRPSEGARLVALNMALAGTPRAETARYLRENFELGDAEELLDEVYARAGG